MMPMPGGGMPPMSPSPAGPMGPPPPMGGHAMLAQRYSNPMYKNPVLTPEGEFDPSIFGDLTSPMPPPMGGQNGGMGMSQDSSMGQLGGDMGMDPQSMDPNAAYTESQKPDVKAQMIQFLAQKAMARKMASEKFQTMGMQAALGSSSGTPSGSPPKL